jgi:hypothetical protein
MYLLRSFVHLCLACVITFRFSTVTSDLAIKMLISLAMIKMYMLLVYGQRLRRVCIILINIYYEHFSQL